MANNEVMEQAEIIEQVVEDQNGGLFAPVAIIGGSMVAGALLWNYVAKPVGRFFKGKFEKIRKPKEIEVEGTVELTDEESED